MKPYQNFQVAAYVYAYYLKDADDATIQKGIDFYRQYIDLRKVYVENHRGTVDIPVERLRQGKVYDYVQFPKAPGRLKQYIFNLADFAILLGGLCLSLRKKRIRKESAE